METLKSIWAAIDAGRKIRQNQAAQRRMYNRMAMLNALKKSQSDRALANQLRENYFKQHPLPTKPATKRLRPDVIPGQEASWFKEYFKGHPQPRRLK